MRKHRTRLRRVWELICTMILVLVLMTSGKVSDTYALTTDGTAPQNDTTDFMEYTTGISKSFNIRGKYNDSFIKTTYSNGGYMTAVQVAGGTKTELTSILNGQVRNVDGIDVQLKLETKQNGRAIQVSYIMQNNNSSSKTVNIGSSADTQVGDNDYARVTKTSHSFEMIDDNSAKATYGAKFSLESIDGDFTTTWIGHYGSAYDNMYENASDPYVENIDSGLAYSWTVSIPAGQTVTRSCMFKVDSVLELGDCTVTADVANEKLMVTAPYEYQSGKTQELYYSIDNGSFTAYGTRSTSLSDGSGSFSNIPIDVSSLGWEAGSTHKISFYIKDVTDSNAKLKTRTLTYSVYWPPTTSEGETLKTIKFANSYTLFADIMNKEGATITLPSDSQSGYAFLGWDTRADGKGTRYHAGDTYTIAGNAILYAQWEAAFNANVSVYLDGDTYNYVSIKLKNSTYGTFDNGVAVPNGTYEIWADGIDTGKTVTVNGAEGRTILYYYSVNYDVNGGTLSSAGRTIVLSGNTYTVTDEIPERLCYIFNGWGYNGKQYLAGDVITVNNKVTLTADWTANHTMSDYIGTSEGHYRKCTVDGCDYVEPIEEHHYGDYIYNNDAQPGKDGTKSRICSICHYEDVITVAGTGNLETKYKNVHDIYTELKGRNTKTDDEAALEEIQAGAEQLLQNELIDYLSEDKKSELQDIINYAENELNRLSTIKQEFEDIITDMKDIPDTDVVTTTSKSSVNDMKEKITEFLESYGNNLTESQKTEIEEMLTKLEMLSQKIEDVENALDTISDINALIPSISSVKTTDKDNVTKLIDDVKNLLEESGNNLTDSQKDDLQEIINSANKKLEKIQKVEEAYNSALNEAKKLPELTDVKTTDETVIKDVKSEVEKILNDYEQNFTEEQKEYINNIITETNDELKKISDIRIDVNVVDRLQSRLPEYENVSSSDRDNINVIKSMAEDIMNTYKDGNFTDEQRETVQNVINKADALLDKIELIEEKNAAKAEIDDNAEEAKRLIDSLIDLTDEEKEELKQAVDKKAEEAKTAIDEVTNPENKSDVSVKKEEVIADTTDIKKKAENKDLSNAKEKAKEEIEKKATEEKAAIDALPDLTDDEKEELKKDIDKKAEEAKKSIEAVTNPVNKSEVSVKKDEAFTGADEVKKEAENKDLSNAKDKAKEEIEKKAVEEKAAIDALPDLTDEEKEELKQAVDKKAEEAKKSIDAVTNPEDKSEVGSAKDEAFTGTDEVKKEAETKDLSNAKDKAKEEIEKKAEEEKAAIDTLPDLTDEEKEELKQVVDKKAEEAKKSIDAVTNPEAKSEVGSTKEEAFAGTEEVKKEAETKDLDNAKGKAKEEIEKKAEEEKAAIDTLPDLTDDEKEELKKDIDKKAEEAKKSIDEVTNPENKSEVGSTKEEAFVGTDEVKKEAENKDLDNAKEKAKEEIEKKAVEEKAAIDALPDLTDDEKEELKKDIDKKAEEAKKSIEVVTNPENKSEVGSTKEEAFAGTEEVKKEAETKDLDNAKEKAKEEIEKKAAEEKAAIDSLPDLTDDEKEELKKDIDKKAEEAKKSIEEVTNPEDKSEVGFARDDAFAGTDEVKKEAETKDLDNAKEKAKEEIEKKAAEEKAAINALSDLTEDEKEELKKDIDKKAEEAKKSIDEVTNPEDKSEVVDKKNEAITVTDEVKKEAETKDLANAKEKAKEEVEKKAAEEKAAIDSLPDLREEEKEELKKDIDKKAEEAKESIDEVTNPEDKSEVGFAKDEAFVGTDEVKKEAENKDLSNTKEKAKEEIEKKAAEEKAAIDSLPDLTDDEKEELKKDIDKKAEEAKKSIDEVTNPENKSEVGSAKEEAFAGTDEVKKEAETKDLDNAKEKAKEEIKKKAAEEKAAIDALSDLTDEEKDELKKDIDKKAEEAKKSIDEVTNPEDKSEVGSTKEEAFVGTNEVKKEAENKDLANAKEKAKEEIEKKAAEEKAAIDALPDITDEEKEELKKDIDKKAEEAKKSIDEVTNPENKSEVGSAKDDAFTVTDEVKKEAETKDLDNAKEKAKEEIEKKAAEEKAVIDALPDLTDDEKEELKQAVDKKAEEAKKSIEAVTSPEDKSEVGFAKDEAFVGTDEVKKEAENKDLSNAKEKAKEEIEKKAAEEKAAIDSLPDLTDEEKEELKKDIDKKAEEAKKSIDEITNPEDKSDVSVKKDDVFKVVDSIKKDAEEKDSFNADNKEIISETTESVKTGDRGIINVMLYVILMCLSSTMMITLKKKQNN